MNARNHTFIDAYGLDISDELEASHAAAAGRVFGSSKKVDLTDGPANQPQRTHRFDGAARRTGLRGPHFTLPRVAPETIVPETNALLPEWDALEANVIDVGAGWSAAPLPPVSEAEAARSTVTVPATHIQGEAEEDINVPAPLAFPVEGKSPRSNLDSVAVAVEQESRRATALKASETESDTQGPVATSIESSVTEPHATHDLDEGIPWVPVWEVDRFQWPADIEQLFQTQTDYFDYAGKKLVAASREGLRVLVVTSTNQGEGSTTLALCLARAAAGAGARVALLDGNLQRSEIGEKLGVDFASGWQGAALNELPLAETAIVGIEEGITLFPSAQAAVSGIASLAEAGVGRVIRTAATNFDLLVIDAGRRELGANVELVDAAIVVRDVRMTSEEETLGTALTLRAQGVKAVGIAENFVAPQASQIAA